MQKKSGTASLEDREMKLWLPGRPSRCRKLPSDPIAEWAGQLSRHPRIFRAWSSRQVRNSRKCNPPECVSSRPRHGRPKWSSRGHWLHCRCRTSQAIMAAIAACVDGSTRELGKPTTKKRLSCAPFRLRALLGLKLALRFEQELRCFHMQPRIQLQKL